MYSILQKSWNILTEPSPKVLEPGERRSARTLAAFILLGLALMPFVLSSTYSAAGVYREARSFMILLVVPQFFVYVLARTRHYRAGVLLEALRFWAGIVVTMTLAPGDPVAFCFLLVPIALCAAMLNQMATMFMAGFCLVTNIGMLIALPSELFSDVLGSQVFLIFCIGLLLYLRRNQALLERERQLALNTVLASHQELLSTTFDGTAIHIHGRIIRADEGFAQLFGLNEADIVYNPLDSLFPEHEHAPLVDMVSQGASRPREFRIRHAENKSRWIELLCQRQIDGAGEPLEILAGRDITERKMMEQQVLFAGRMVAMGTLAAGVAHEINNPLTYVMGHHQLLGRELKPLLQDSPEAERKQVQHRLQVIRDGVDRVRGIVSDLKTFSRSDDDNTVPVHLQNVAETAVQMTWNEIRHRAQLVQEIEATPVVDANPAHLGQVVINLLMNAAQAIPENAEEGMRITLAMGTTEEGDAFIRVQDTGPGIPNDDLQRIFEPFFTTKAVGEGTGLGLSICHNIIQRYGGSIEVATSNQGTEFNICLPASNQQHIEPDLEPESPDLAPTRSAKILVVDDELEIAQLIREMLFEFDVTIAENGQRALEIWGNEDFDVVVCDLMMPKISGLEVYQNILAIGDEREKRMLFITGGAFTPATIDFLEETENLWLQKPFDPTALRSAVMDLLEQLPPIHPNIP